MKSTLIRTLVVAPLCCLVAASALAQATPQKKQLAERVVALLKLENVAVAMIQRPAIDALTQSRLALQQRVEESKIEPTMKSIAVDVQAFMDQAGPIALAAGKRADVDVVVPMLMKDFSEDELKQLVTMLESPVRAKFDAELPGLQKALGEKVAADVKGQIDPKMKAMTEAVGTKLRNAASGK